MDKALPCSVNREGEQVWCDSVICHVGAAASSPSTQACSTLVCDLLSLVTLRGASRCVRASYLIQRAEPQSALCYFCLIIWGEPLSADLKTRCHDDTGGTTRGPEIQAVRTGFHRNSSGNLLAEWLRCSLSRCRENSSWCFTSSQSDEAFRWTVAQTGARWLGQSQQTGARCSSSLWLWGVMKLQSEAGGVFSFPASSMDENSAHAPSRSQMLEQHRHHDVSLPDSRAAAARVKRLVSLLVRHHNESLVA